jgi:hypothetical protein
MEAKNSKLKLTDVILALIPYAVIGCICYGVYEGVVYLLSFI